ncbi:MAG TPA: DUF3313 domain-containing protein [Thiobacillaceae bacterium]|nr:DUF3313 domain-containing protein [Thiobacillaceae bacterium]
MKTHLTAFPALLLALAMVVAPSSVFAAGQGSEFLDIHPALKPDADRPGAQLWEKPGLNRAKYTKVMFEPLSIFVDPDSEYKGLNSDDVKTLAAGFRDVIVRTLEPEIPVVEVAGSGVLYVRAALTHVKLKKAKRGLLGYTPIGLLVTAAQDAAGKRVSLQGASLELEAYDATTGEPVGVIIDRHLETSASGKEELSWKGIEDVFKFYASRFKSRMLSAQGKPAN